MSIFGSVTTNKPQYWDMYMPKPGDFDTIDAYNAAMDDYRTWLGSTPVGQPAGQAPTIDPVTGFRTAGSQRMANMTQAQYAAQYLNSRLQSALAAGPDHPNYRQALAELTSRARIRPDEMQAAYMAINPDGTPVLSEPILALLEKLGIRPMEYKPSTDTKQPPVEAPPAWIPPDFVAMPRPPYEDPRKDLPGFVAGLDRYTDMRYIEKPKPNLDPEQIAEFQAAVQDLFANNRQPTVRPNITSDPMAIAAFEDMLKRKYAGGQPHIMPARRTTGYGY